MTWTNSRSTDFLASIPTASLDSVDDKLSSRCKFNFSYMDFNQPAGQTFEDWSPDQLVKLSNKIFEYSKHPLRYWITQRVGGGGRKVLEIYGRFPKKSEFKHPNHVPHQACWARFRLEGKVRFVGFIVPDSYNEKRHERNNCLFDNNTFYAVFLDRDHLFYK